MNIVVTIDAQQFPITPIRRIVVVIMILVMDSEIFKLFPGKFPTADTADPWEQFKSLLPIRILTLCLVAQSFVRHSCIIFALVLHILLSTPGENTKKGSSPIRILNPFFLPETIVFIFFCGDAFPVASGDDDRDDPDELLAWFQEVDYQQFATEKAKLESIREHLRRMQRFRQDPDAFLAETERLWNDSG